MGAIDGDDLDGKHLLPTAEVQRDVSRAAAPSRATEVYNRFHMLEDEANDVDLEVAMHGLDTKFSELQVMVDQVIDESNICGLTSAYNQCERASVQCQDSCCNSVPAVEMPATRAWIE